MLEKLQTVILALLAVVAFMVAMPRWNFEYKGKKYEINNINPSDLNLDLIEDEFAYKPALDLQGGYSVTFDLDMQGYPAEGLEKYEQVKSTISQRMALIGFKDFEFTSLLNPEKDLYSFRLTTPDRVDENLLVILSSPGKLQALIDDPDAIEGEESIDSTSLYPGKITADISNADIANVRVVSDSRIYSTDPETPYNYGLEIEFKNESKQKLNSALISNYSKSSPLFFLLDDSIVAVQASGFQIDPFSDNDSLLLYTTLDDTKLSNSVIASVMNSPEIDVPISVGDTVEINPLLGNSLLGKLRQGTIISVVLVHIVLILLMKKSSILLLVSIDLYSVLLIALHKILGFNLSLSLIAASIVMVAFFALRMNDIVNRLKVSENLKKKSVLKTIKIDDISAKSLILRLLIFVPIILFFENLLTVSVNQFVQGIILAVIVWILFDYFYLKLLVKRFHSYV